MSEIQMISDRGLALSVMKETIRWCERRGILLGASWREEKCRDARNGGYFVFLLDGKPCGACVLRDFDSDKEWKKYKRSGRHLYVGKLCVADGFHGKNMPREMLDAIKRKADAEGFDSVRLTADARIAPIYINAGFFPHWTFKGAKTGKTFVRMAWYRWTPDEFENIWRGPGRTNLRRIIYKTIKRALWFL